LPYNFIPRLPPCYLGQPGAYLPDLSAFDANFTALCLKLQDWPKPMDSLEAQYGQRILEGLPVGEVKDQGVFQCELNLSVKCLTPYTSILDPCVLCFEVTED
jgi:hypothetical protein